MNDSNEQKIEDTGDAWEHGGALGNEDAFTAKAPTDISAELDDALGLVPISIRLQKGLLENLKALSQLNGIGYQPLIRQVLTRFVDCELKHMLRERIQEKKEEDQAENLLPKPTSFERDERNAA